MSRIPASAGKATPRWMGRPPHCRRPARWSDRSRPMRRRSDGVIVPAHADMAKRRVDIWLEQRLHELLPIGVTMSKLFRNFAIALLVGAAAALILQLSGDP